MSENAVPLARVVGLFGAASALKACLIPLDLYRSTDFEVHRNWLAITYSLPVHRWYYEDRSEWTLDYPPFFAYFEWLLAQFAVGIDPKMVIVENLNYASPATVVFQRASVIVTDVMLLVGACMWIQTWSRGRTGDPSVISERAALVAALLFFNPGLLFVDHIHFQYNGVMFGILIASLSLVREYRDAFGAFTFACLLMMKHIFAYIVPVYGLYLLGHYCWGHVEGAAQPVRDGSQLEGDSEDEGGRDPITETNCTPQKTGGWGAFRPLAFCQLAVLGAAVLGAAFGPMLASAWLQGGAPAAVAYFSQILSRLFPFQRGLCHAYWAPNVWAIYNVADKVLATVLKRVPYFKGFVKADSASMTGGLVEVASHAMLPNILPGHTFLLTLVAMTPVLWSVLRRPHPQLFSWAVVYCQFCSFMLGYHVHEKAILMAIVPLSLTCTDSPGDAKIYLIVSWVGHFSLFPLLYERREEPIKLAFFVSHVVLSFVLLHRYHKRRQHALGRLPKGVTFAAFEIAYFVLLVAVYLFTSVVHPRFFSRQDGTVILPFLPLMMMSVSCSVGLVYAWVLTLCYFHRKSSRLWAKPSKTKDS